MRHSDKFFRKLCDEAIRQHKILQAMSMDLARLLPACAIEDCPHLAVVHLRSRYCHPHTIHFNGGTLDTFLELPHLAIPYKAVMPVFLS